MAKDNITDKEKAIKEGRSVAYWKEELRYAKKREKGYRKKAKEAVKIYEAEDSGRIPYNILFSNTITLKSAIYNKPPRPNISRRFKDKDVLGKVSAQVIERMLIFIMDSNDQDYSDFDQLATSSIIEGLVAGRGLSRFKYEAEISDEVVQSEMVFGEEVPWDRIYFGYAKRWSKVPWFAIESFMNREELEENFPDVEDYKKLLVVKTDENDGDDDEVNPPKDTEGADLAQIYEIWDKQDRKVYFICPEYDKPLKVVEDPLKLEGFFPIPKPLTFGDKISSMLPVPLYKYYEEQALELNRITIRINRIIKALKVRGFYDSSIDGIGKVLEADDNTLLPADGVSALMDGRTLEKSIWIMPIEKLVVVLQQLYIDRESIKAIIQELSGIADIMRGASKASETLGAQQMKTQWGGMRIGTYRREVELYLRNCLRIIAEIGLKHFSQDTIIKMVNIKLLTNEQKQEMQARMEQMKQMAALGQQMPQPPPEVVQLLQSPTWEEVLSLCKNDTLKNYKLDIETNSTVELDSSEDKKEIGEFLNALAQFLNGVMPIVQTGMVPASAVKAVMMSVTRKFKFGTEVEEEFEKIQQPKPEDDGKAKAEQQKMGIEQKKAEMEIQLKSAELQMKQKEGQAKMEEIQLNSNLSKMEYEMKLKEINRKDSLAQQQFASKVKMISMKEKEAAMASQSAKTKKETE